MSFQQLIILLNKITFQFSQIKKEFIRNHREFYLQLLTKHSTQINSRLQLILLPLTKTLRSMIYSWISLKLWWLIQKCSDMKINSQKVSMYSIGKMNQSKELKWKFLRETKLSPTTTWTRTVSSYLSIDADKANTDSKRSRR